MLDPFNQLYTPGVRRLYHFEFHEEQHLLTAELRRTVDHLCSAVEARIAKGTATRQDVETVRAIWSAIAADLEAQDAWLAAGAGAAGWSLADKLKDLRASSEVAWSTKVKAMRREIEARRRSYPADVQKGRLTGDQAKQQLEALEAVHDLYWRHGYAFDGTRDELRALGEVVADHALHEQQAA
jgi:hypothetical protein